jgi:hypothetical protein
LDSDVEVTRQYLDHLQCKQIPPSEARTVCFVR